MLYAVFLYGRSSNTSPATTKLMLAPAIGKAKSLNKWSDDR